MGWLSDTWKSVKDTASDAWSGVKDEVRDITGVDSMNSLFATGGLAMVPANLSGQGMLGEAFTGALAPLMGQQQMPPGMQGGQLTGPLMGSPAASMTMGSGGQPSPVQAGPQDLAGLFGESGYQYGPSQTSTALLQANPEAYQYSPLMNGIS